ncbi:MAG: hypothetical protein AAFQ76_10030 [Cyanobacteria bacterium J06626_26]
MIKPSDKVLIGWITLLATFASANLGQVSANELTNLEPSASTADWESAQGANIVAAANTAVANNLESIDPQGSQQLEVSSQPALPAPQKTEAVAASVTSPEPPAQANDSAAKLEHLVVTATQPLPVASPQVSGEAEQPAQSPDGLTDGLTVDSSPAQSDSSAAKLNHLVGTATREIPATSSLRSASLTSQRSPLQTSQVSLSESLPDRASNSAIAAPAAASPSGIEQPSNNDVYTSAAPIESRPSPSPAADVPEGALPTARVILPGASAVVAERELASNGRRNAEVGVVALRRQRPSVSPDPQVKPQASPQINNSRVTLQASPQANNSQVTPQPRPQVTPQAKFPAVGTVAAIPEGAIPSSIVLTPNAGNSGIAVSETAGGETAQLPLEPPLQNPDAPTQAEIDELLLEIEQPTVTTPRPYQNSPAITISNPSGFGADNFTAFVGVGYQERTRFGNLDDGGVVFGVGLGDARENVGVQLSYTLASFGGSRDFGTGGFNAKVHRRLTDEWSVALGWEGFATTGFVDFKDSIYGSVSHLVRTRESITEPFSRVALTAGVGNGRFRTEDDVFDDRDNINVFGSAAVRVVEPVSAIVEWTGQDLAAGLSITPFRDLPLVLLPAVRDITGAGDGGRFVLGAGVSFQL